MQELIAGIERVKAGNVKALSASKLRDKIVMIEYMAKHLETVKKQLVEEAVERKLNWQDPVQYPQYDLQFSTGYGNKTTEYNVAKLYKMLAPNDLCAVVKVNAASVDKLSKERREYVQQAIDSVARTIESDRIVAKVHRIKANISKHV